MLNIFAKTSHCLFVYRSIFFFMMIKFIQNYVWEICHHRCQNCSILLFLHIILTGLHLTCVTLTLNIAHRESMHCPQCSLIRAEPETELSPRVMSHGPSQFPRLSLAECDLFWPLIGQGWCSDSFLPSDWLMVSSPGLGLVHTLLTQVHTLTNCQVPGK